MSNLELENKIYSMSNSFLPLDMFYNDIRDIDEKIYDKESAYKDLEKIADFIIDLQSQLDQLKQQLAEKDCRIEELEGQFAYECECNKQLVELQKQLEEKQNTIDEINKEFVQAVHDWKALCAEKDKEIETMKKDSDKNIDYLVEFASLIENEKDCNRMLKALDRVKSGNKYIIDKANQSKTQLAIQELEKVKELVKDKSAWSSPFGLLKIQESDVEQIINQQIKELKGE